MKKPLDFPLKQETFIRLLDMTIWEVDAGLKKAMLAEILKFYPFFEPLCKNADADFKVTEKECGKKRKRGDGFCTGSVPEIILAVMAAVTPTVSFISCGDEILEQYRKEADLFYSILSDGKDFDGLLFGLECRKKAEEDLLHFITRQLLALYPPEDSEKEFHDAFRTLFAWGLFLSDLRAAQNPGKYRRKKLSGYMKYLMEMNGLQDPLEDIAHSGERGKKVLAGVDTADHEEKKQIEVYDFDRKNPRILQLHVKLIGYKVSADVLVREDSTFEDLHNFLFDLFERFEEHLYRFECDDGLLAIRPEEKEVDDFDEDENEGADTTFSTTGITGSTASR